MEKGAEEEKQARTVGVIDEAENEPEEQHHEDFNRRDPGHDGGAV